MEQRIVEFIAALRAVGVRISIAESEDAFNATRFMGVTNPTSTADAQLFIELQPIENRTRSSQQILAAIRDEAGPLNDAEAVVFEELDGCLFSLLWRPFAHCLHTLARR